MPSKGITNTTRDNEVYEGYLSELAQITLVNLVISRGIGNSLAWHLLLPLGLVLSY